jgi:NADH-quinone oxidoreductase subunit F
MTDLPLTGRARPDRTPHSLAEWQALGGYAAVRAGAAMTPAEVVDIVGRRPTSTAAAARAFRPRQVALHAGARHIARRRPQLPDRQRRRDGARRLQGPPPARGAAASGDRGRHHRRPRHPRDRGHRPDPRRVPRRHRQHRRAIAEAEAAGLLGPDILGTGVGADHAVHPSAGRYIVGEETALIAALEGAAPSRASARPFRRSRASGAAPPRSTTSRRSRSSRHILAHGAQWFRALSRTEEGGTKLYGVSGRVHRPGLIEMPDGHHGARTDRAGRGRVGQRRAALLSARRRRLGLPRGRRTRPAARLRPCAAGRVDVRHRHHDRAGPDRLPDRRARPPHALLRPRKLRLVHALPRGAALGRPHPRRAGGRHGASPATSTSCA